ncbi:MAG: hypothetical protein QNJ47_25460 [Nostocaceae cyanobacterium]|nr:hypothetical protein [Nostocaceae cyanobacterium]
MLRTDLKALEQRYETAQVPLKNLEIERQKVVSRLSNFIADTKPIVQQKALAFYQELADKKLNEWMNEYEIKEPVEFFKLEWVTQQINRVVEEVTNHLASKIESEFVSWQNSELQPLLINRLENLTMELQERAKVFTKDAENLKTQLFNDAVVEKDSIKYQEAEVSLMERILAAAGGYLIGDFGSAALGAVFGYQEMLKSLIPQIGLGIATLIFSHLY